jgi:hypothetical protein
VIVVATGVPNWSLSVTSTFAMPGSPRSCTPKLAPSSHTRPATLALVELGWTTILVSESLSGRLLASWRSRVRSPHRPGMRLPQEFLNVPARAVLRRRETP